MVDERLSDASRRRRVRDRDLAALSRAFGGPPPRDAIRAVRRDLGLPPLPSA